MARRRLGSRSPAQTLDTTALVHEAYLKLFDQTRLEWQDRRHFYSVVAMAMRQIIVDHARRRIARKRGGGQNPVDLDIVEIGADDRIEELLAVHEALEKLKALDERLARLVEMRYFGGFSVEETAKLLELSERTVKRDWRKARALLYEELRHRREG
jgi:RNA polymerase sigma factor (TIGR02999 family)